MATLPQSPEFLDSFDPSRVRTIILEQITQLRMDLANHKRFDSEIPHVADWNNSIIAAIAQRERYINEILPHMLAWRALIRKLSTIDKRFDRISPPKRDLSELIFISLRSDESYRDFKLIAGKIVLAGFTLVDGVADHDFGSVDFHFTALGGKATLKIYVKPGESQTCQIQEMTETREVTVKKIVCDGVVAGEMADAQLTNQQRLVATPYLEREIPSLGGEK